MSRKLWVRSLMIAGLLVVAGVVFVNVVGLEEPQIEIVQAPAYYLAGTAYKGSAKDKALGTLFKDAETLVARDSSLRVAAIYSVAPADSNDFYVEALVGVILPDSSYQVPAGLTRSIWPAQKVIRGKVSGNYLLQGRLYEQIEDHAREQGLKVDLNRSLERYFGKQDVEIDVPIL